MQETWLLNLQVKDDKSADYLTSLEELIQQKSKEIGIYLSYYFKSEGGLVEGVQLKDDITFADRTSGELKVNFRIIYYNACLNINEDNKDEMVLNFQIIPSERKVKFTGPLWPEREPDEI